MLITKPFKKISISMKFEQFSKLLLEFISPETGQCRAGIEAQVASSNCGSCNCGCAMQFEMDNRSCERGFLGMTFFRKIGRISVKLIFSYIEH